jgi:hypothetical protein
MSSTNLQPSGSAAAESRAPLARIQRLGSRRADLLAAGGLLLLTLALYLPYATKAGWFLDDWSIYSEEKGIDGSYWDRMSQCMGKIPGGRKPACLYHVTEWSLFSNHHWAYHLASIFFLVAIAWLLYAILRRARLGRPWSLLAAAAVIVFPGADSTRLWPVASIGQYVIVLQLSSLLLVLVALGKPAGRRRKILNVAAALLALLAMSTYEIVVPLVALQGFVYLVVFRDRSAVLRWMLDLGLVLAFVLYRLILAPVDSEALLTPRTSGELLSRVGTLLLGAWHSWHSLYAPGGLLLVIGAIVVAAVAATIFSPVLRARLTAWWLLLGAAAVAAGACALVFLTAEDTYVPMVFSTYNRVNLPGTIPYVLAAIAVLGLLFEIVRHLSPWTFAGPVAVAMVAAAIVGHQLSVSDEHQEEWLNSWSIQKETIPALRAAMRTVPTGARVFGFDTPQWERDWIPVLVQTWNLRGLIAYETPVHPNYASPFHEGLACERRGVAETRRVVAGYDDRAHPVYFASPSRGRSVRVQSRAECRRLVKAWGYVPYWTSAAS